MELQQQRKVYLYTILNFKFEIELTVDTERVCWKSGQGINPNGDIAHTVRVEIRICTMRKTNMCQPTNSQLRIATDRTREYLSHSFVNHLS
jgi:hypothetical protein